MSLSSLAHLPLLNSFVLFLRYYNIDYDPTKPLRGKNAVNLMLLVNGIELPSYRMPAHSQHSHYYTFCNFTTQTTFDLCLPIPSQMASFLSPAVPPRMVLDRAYFPTTEAGFHYVAVY